MRKLFAGLVVAMGLFLGVGGAPGLDSLGLNASAIAAEPATKAKTVKVTLKDGRVIEGELVRELDGNVWIKHSIKGVESTDFFSETDVVKIDRGGATPEKADPEKAKPVADDAIASSEQTSKPGVPKGIVLTCGDRENGDMVGLFITVHAFQQIMPMLEKDLGTDGSGILVLRISSGGGALFEMIKLTKYIHTEFKSRFRTVLWVDSAISAAAMMGHSCEEIYFTPQGNFGACTGWHGQLVAMKDLGLEKILYEMEKVSELGRHDFRIMRSMQIQEPLSATVDENGQVTFYQDLTSGQFVVNRANEILTLNAETAAKIKFSRGTAATLGELTKLMGYTEVNWLGKEVAGTPWPVSRAEDWMLKYRKQVKQDEERTQEYYTNYQQSVQSAQGAGTREKRAPFVGRARAALAKMKEVARTNPNTILFQLNAPDMDAFKTWLDEQERLLRDLMK